MPKATLLVIQGTDQGARFELEDSEVTLGRGALNPIRLMDDEVSRTHASIAFDPEAGGFVLTDCGSSNGTFVNGESVRSRKLADGDQIAVGKSALLFQAEPVPEPARAVADNLDLFVLDDIRDRSSIVGEVSREVGEQVLRDATAIIRSTSVSQTLANLQVLYRINKLYLTDCRPNGCTGSPRPPCPVA